MSDRTREASKDPRPTTVLDPLRPAVVVRRRVYDAAVVEKEAEAPRAFTSTESAPDDDESGPPSSINVARALASLRSDELQRVEELVRADEEDEAEDAEDVEPVEVEPVEPPVPQAPTLTLGKTIPLAELARRMGMSAEELPVTLVARGFYALDAKTVLPRQTARVIAELYGWKVEDAPLDEGEEGRDEAPPAKSGTRSRIATKRKARAKPKPKVKAKAKAKAKAAKPKVVASRGRAQPAKRRLAR